MLHTRVKIMCHDQGESIEGYEKRINDFIKDKNIKGMVSNNNLLIIHYSDNTY